ncbi:MAG TPA: hypothetical protein VLA95_03750 [Gemmatimonadales bacterium]|nr:hypothetical protein [Gemmatimonadales bacterium]
MPDPAARPPCPACAAPLSPGAAWCHRCGARAAGGDPHRALWVAAVGASLLFTGFIAWKANQFNSAPPPAMANAGNAGAAPGRASAGGAAAVDLASMSPRERFDRLFARVMTAAEQGDTAQALQFAPMALMAYAQLDRVDQDARFHVALVQAQTGDWAAAAATADTMLAQTPDHLLALLVLEAAAVRQGDAPAAADLRRRFLAAESRELAAGRQEYTDHRDALDEFRARAGGR